MVIPIMISCSSKKYVVRDYRYKIANAKVWKPKYILNDSASGIKLEFITKIKKIIDFIGYLNQKIGINLNISIYIYGNILWTL